ncbi:MAG: alpha/beta hydrolase [Polyangiaceae bacterium]
MGLALGERDGAVLVTRVAPDTPAARAGVLVGEALVGIDGERASSSAVVRARMASVTEGEEVLLLLRGEDGREREVSVEAAPKPLEVHDGCDVVYDAIEHDGARLRRIVTVPRDARAPRPWMLYVQGHGAASVDAGGTPDRPLAALAAAFARRGVAFVRVERSGMGDSEGPALRELDLTAEASLYASAFDATARRPGLDPEGAFLFGHSLGAVIAGALVAERRAHARGMIVYGGGAKTWTEYFDESCRRQWSLAGVPLVDQDSALRKLQRFHALAIVAQLPLEEVRRRMPEIADEPSLFGLDERGGMRGRPLRYWQELEQVPIPAHLAAARIPVLAAWGSSDWLAFRDDHELVAACVNEGAPGRGTFAEIPRADHGFADRASEAGAFGAKDPGTLSEALATTLADWTVSLAREAR